MSATTADEDATALGAIRSANAILARHDLTWTQVLNRVVTIEDVIEDDPDRPDAAETTQLFDRAMDLARGQHVETVRAMREVWQREGTLGPRQRMILEMITGTRR